MVQSILSHANWLLTNVQQTANKAHPVLPQLAGYHLGIRTRATAAAQPQKGRTAPWAAVGLLRIIFLRVLQQMYFQAISTRVLLTAEMAHMRLLSTVAQHVAFQVHRLRKTPQTDVALKRSRARVHQKMAFQSARKGEFLVALFAAKDLLARWCDDLIYQLFLRQPCLFCSHWTTCRQLNRNKMNLHE